MHPRTWEASGHVGAFNDPLIDNKDSKKRYRADVLIEEWLAKQDDKIQKEVDKAKKRFKENFNEEQYRSTSPRVLEIAAARDSVHKRFADALNANDLEEFPLAEVITPNIPEGEVLSGIKIQSESDMERAAKEIGDSCGCAVLLKGGHSINDANDLLYHNGTFTWFTGKRINNPNTHGTGCTLSSAIASGLAKGLSLPDAISAAKEYISGALASMMDLGHGSGPLNHAYRI